MNLIHRRQRHQLAQLVFNELLKVAPSQRTDIILARSLLPSDLPQAAARLRTRMDSLIDKADGKSVLGV